MSEQKHFLKSVNLTKDEKINLLDRWILACLVKGIQGKGNVSKISFDKIAEYCKYTNDKNEESKFGIKSIQSSINRLEEAKLIKVIKPIKRGQCTSYKIRDISSYEKINEDFFKLDLSPVAKGYILSILQHNLNKDEETHQPNEVKTKTTYNIVELSNMFNTPISSLYKIEKTLKDLGILTVENDPEQKRDQETGLLIQNREIDLQKVGLEEFVVNALINHEQRITDIENNTVTKEELSRQLEELKTELLWKLSTR